MLQRFRTFPAALAASSLLPLLLLLLALLPVFILSPSRSYLMRDYDSVSSQGMTLAANLSPQHNFLMFHRQTLDGNGNPGYEPYNRFPIGGYALVKLAILPFDYSLTAQIYAARLLMLAFFAATAVLAYQSLCRLVANRWLALSATLLAFSACQFFYYNAIIGGVMFHLFGILLTFHGMVIFRQEGRFRQLLLKTAAALLLGWHVYALLLPFIALGLGQELLRRPSGAASPAAPLPPRQPRLGAFLRSRYLHLGIFALLFGLGLLTFNLGNEYLALDGRRSLTDLPTVRSVLFRFGADSGRSAAHAELLAWSNYLEQQLYRLNLMSIPYALTGWFDVLDKKPSDLLLWQPILIFIVVTGTTLAGLIWGRCRLLLTTLALSAILWAAVMRHQAAFHPFEGIVYVGITLVFFTTILLTLDHLTRRFLGPSLPIIAALAAAPLFILSARQVNAEIYDPEVAAIHQELLSDAERIRKHTAGKTVFIPLSDEYGALTRFAGVWLGLDYYLHDSVILFAHQEKFYPRADFIITGQPEPGPALLTPQNKRLFLHDRAAYTGQYGSLVSGPPTAAGFYDLYLRGNILTYLKEPCKDLNTQARFSLHLYPLFPHDVPPERRQYGFNNLDFHFGDFYARSGDKCFLTVPLPDYPLTEIETGQGDHWQLRFPVDNTDLYRAAYFAATANEPIHRAPFDLYLQDDRLYYIKEPCAPADIAHRFYLHLVPVNPADLPPDRQQHGTDNLDFAFARRGARFDGKCLAVAALPGYPVKEIRTGQFTIGGPRLWETSFPPPLQPSSP